MQLPAMFKNRGALVLASIAVLAVCATAYLVFLPGLSVARKDPPKLEVEIATWLLRHSVPDAVVKAVNPLGAHPDTAEVRAGHDLFM